MGVDLSKEQKDHLLQLRGLLQATGCKVPRKSQLSDFLQVVDKQCPWYRKSGSLKLDDWERMAHWLRQSMGPDTIQHLTIWNLCRLAIRPIQGAPSPFKKKNFNPNVSFTAYFCP